MKELQRRLDRVPVDREAEERTWAVVRAAFAEREPVRARRRWRTMLGVVVVAAAVGAAIVSPPGRAVVAAMRRSIGIEHAAPALFRLPAPGRLLVSGAGGTWVVSADGSRRRLGSYAQAAWSPHGLYVVAASRTTLAALDPRQGDVHWSLARRAIASPSWGGTLTDTRVAYLSGGRLHVVGGDGRGDTVVGPAAHVVPAWRPSQPEQHVLAYVDAAGHVVVGEPGGRRLWRSAALDPGPRLLAWSPDGSRLAVATPAQLWLFDGRTGRAAGFSLPGIRALSYARDGRLAVLRGRSVALVGRGGAVRTVFSGPARLAGIAWSPNGRWLATALPAADQWVFLGGHRVLAASHIARQLGGAVRLDGWAPGA